MRANLNLTLANLTALWVLSLFLLSPTTALAQGSLAYSFESDLQGFGPNGIGITVTQDTIGATEGTQSMKVSIVQPATFVGALTGNLDSLIFGDPPGVDLVILDLTITEQFPNNPGDFVDAGITVFGSTQPDFPGGQQEGLQAQFFLNQVPLGDLTAGTHQIFLELNSATHPVTFVEGSFNDIFGVEGSGPNDIIPTGFQVYINKSGTAPWTGYIDNIRFAQKLEGDFDNDGDVDGNDFLVWQRGGTDPPLDPNTLTQWQLNYGAGANLVAAVGVVPEPSCGLLMILGLGSLHAVNRKFLFSRITVH